MLSNFAEITIFFFGVISTVKSHDLQLVLNIGNADAKFISCMGVLIIK